MRKKLLYVAIIFVASLTIQAQEIDGVVVATENFDAATEVPPTIMGFGGSEIALTSAADVNGTGQGVQYTYMTDFFSDEEILLASFPNMPPGDYVFRYQIQANIQGFAYNSVITTNSTVGPFVLGNFPGGSFGFNEFLGFNELGDFVTDFSPQLTTTTTGDINFIIYLSGSFFAFADDTIFVDNIELIRLNDRLPLNVPGSSVVATEDFESATVPTATGTEDFVNSVTLSTNAAVGGTGQGLEFTYSTGFSDTVLNDNRVISRVEVATFTDVAPGRYFIQYEIDSDSNNQNLSYYNQIISGRNILDNYITLSDDVSAGFEINRTYAVELTTTSDISLTWNASPLLGNNGGDNIFIDNIQLVNVNDPVLSLDEFSTTNNQLQLYPNPTNGQIVLSNQDGVSLNELTIVNINGVIVKKVILDKQDAQQTIDVNDLSSGIYFFNIQTGATIQTSKVIVN